MLKDVRVEIEMSESQFEEVVRSNASRCLVIRKNARKFHLGTRLAQIYNWNFGIVYDLSEDCLRFADTRKDSVELDGCQIFSVWAIQKSEETCIKNPTCFMRILRDPGQPRTRGREIHRDQNSPTIAPFGFISRSHATLNIATKPHKSTRISKNDE
jgi:hypothetical protein